MMPDAQDVQPSEPMNGSLTCFTSDLHLFASRSQAEEHYPAILDAAKRAEVFVLGGDIFDFRWSTLGSMDASLTAAIDWLDTLVSHAPDCQFHYVLGNHDHHDAFVERLAHWADDMPNLEWDPYYVRLGRSVFLHGDVADRKRHLYRLADIRAKKQHRRSRGPLENRLYDLAVSANVHAVTGQLVNRRRKVARRIAKYLDSIGHGAKDGVRDVYFGHTHRPMSNYRYGGLTFHNGGAPIKGLEFQILETETAI